MKRKYLSYAILPVMALALVGGVSMARASGMGFFGSNATPEEVADRQAQMFQDQANLLGVGVDKVKDAWAKGQSIKDLAEENGVSEDQLRQKMQEQMQQHIKDRLQILVDKGVITQAQADERLQFMQQQVQDGKHGMMKRGMRHPGGMDMMF